MRQSRAVARATVHQIGVVRNECARHFQSLYAVLKSSSFHLTYMKVRFTKSQLTTGTTQVFRAIGHIVGNELRDMTCKEQQLSKSTSLADLRLAKNCLKIWSATQNSMERHARRVYYPPDLHRSHEQL